MPLTPMRSRLATLLRLAFLVALVLAAARAEAEGRWALVLGEAEYADDAVPDLTNTVNDSRTIAASLNNKGFRIYYLENATKAEIEATMDRIAAEQKDTDLGLFFYAGHGVQLQGVNYALPSDIAPHEADFLQTGGVSITDLIQRMRGIGTQRLVVVLDSCRNSPFAGQNASGTGLALVDAPENTIIAYSTSPGAVALDGGGANSPYTAALSAALDGPEQDIRDVLRLVRARVRLATGGEQTPWFVDNSRDEIVIQSRKTGFDETELAELAQAKIGFDSTLYRTIAGSSDPRDFETFLQTFPESTLADAARRQLKLIGTEEKPKFPLMDLGLPEANPEVPGGLSSIVTSCDILATGINDVMAVADPVPHDLVNTSAAMRACIAALADDPENPRLLGLMARVLRLLKRHDEANFYALRAAAGGNPSAYGGMASAYRQGMGVERDYETAADYARRGAMLGAPAMRLLMGIYYREGWGVPQSFTESRRWVRLAADNGFAPAMVAYGDFYRRGTGVPKDLSLAFDYYQKAAMLGSTDAMNLIGLAYMKGEGVEPDLARGIQWLGRASDEGNPYAAYHLGRAFRDGWGVDRDLRQSLAFFKLSAQRNYLGAYTSIGDLLAEGGEGLEQNLPEAYANYVIAREASTIRDTKQARDELAEVVTRLGALTPRMTADQIAEGERISRTWINQYGLLDFNLVNE